MCCFAFSANSQRSSVERPFFGCPCPPVVKCVDSTVFFLTGENVPSERVRSKPADIGQLLLQCRRRCSRVIVSLIPPNHTLSLAVVAIICAQCLARRNEPRGKIHPRPRQGLIAAVLASAITKEDRYAKKRKRQPTTTICSNIYTTIRASERAAGPSVESEENSRLIEPKFRGENAVRICKAQRWIAL